MTFPFRFFCIVCSCLAIAMAGRNVFAQDWGWGDGGFDRGYDRRPSPPPPPPYGDQRPGPGGSQWGGAPQGYYGQQQPRPQPYGAQANANPRCRELERQLTGDTQAGQDQLPRIDAEMRQVDAQYHRAESDAEHANCYEDMFFFGRSLKQNPRCIDLDKQVQSAKARLAQLTSQRNAIARGNSSRGRHEEIVAELARNRCGDNYAHEYEQQRSRSASIFSFFTEEEPEDNSVRGDTPTFSPSGYQTKCVRLCDGFYFPISYSTTQSHFQEDAAKCQSQCAAPAELYVQRADQETDQMVSLDGRPYTQLPNAFRNRKVYIRGCSCNQNEYSVEEIAKSEQALKQSKRADAGGKTATDAMPAPRPAPQAASAAPAPKPQPRPNPAPQQANPAQ